MFLKEEIHRLTFPKTFTILDKKAELEMIKDVAEDMGISLKDNTAKKIMSDIDITKQDMSYVELMAGVDKTELKRRASSEKNVDKKVFYNYLKRQCDNYALDFEDLINFTLYILNRNEDVRIRWQEKCQYAGQPRWKASATTFSPCRHGSGAELTRWPLKWLPSIKKLTGGMNYVRTEHFYGGRKRAEQILASGDGGGRLQPR